MGNEGGCEKGERNSNLLSAHVPDTVSSGGNKFGLTLKLLLFLFCISAAFYYKSLNQMLVYFWPSSYILLFLSMLLAYLTWAFTGQW